MSETEHYLKRELYKRVRTEPEIFEFLQAGSLDGIWYWDVERPDQEWMSARFKELFGYSDDEIPSTSQWWQENIFPEDLTIALDNFEKHCADANHPYDQIVRYRHKDGSTIWVRCRGIAIRDAEGKPIRMLGAHTDVTPVKLAELRLDELNRELDAFAYAASHDLRQPLRGIAGFANALDEDYRGRLDARGRHYLERIAAGAQQMARLIDALLTLSRVTRTQFVREETDLAVIARRVTESLTAAEPGREAEFVIPDSIPVWADPRLLESLMQNLLGNAWKFTAVEPIARIELATEMASGEEVYCVRDNGVGFDMDYSDQLFTAFHRLHSEQEFPGLGIGLATVQRIVSRHGGRAWGEGTPGRGAAFRFTLSGNGWLET